jgi:hypothetical protein
MTSMVDNPYLEVANRLISDIHFKPQPADYLTLARFFLASLFRTPWAIDEMRPKVNQGISKALASGGGFNIQDLPFIPNEIKVGFEKGDRVTMLKHGVLVAIAQQVEKSELLASHSKYHKRVIRLTQPGLSFITGDRIMLMMQEKGSHVRTHIAPLSPHVCLAMASDRSGLPSPTSQELFCRLVNEEMWNAARESVVGFPNAPGLCERTLVRGDGRRP